MAAPAGRAAGQPRGSLVHGALILTQVIFGGGAIVGKFGVHGTNPALFALVREGISGPLLFAAACALYPWTRVKLQLADLPRMLGAGTGLFSNQLFFILGLKVSDPVMGSAWQPSQPVFTMLIAVLIGYEALTFRRAGGVALAVGGAVFMVVYGTTAQGMSLTGNLLFLLNCLGTSVYVILTKDLILRYPALAVTGWAYLFGSIMMLAVTIVINSTAELLAFVCSANDAAVKQTCIDEAWSVPVSMIAPLAYWILGTSITAYSCMTWANQYVNASVVSVYTVLQPCTSGLMSAILILTQGDAWAKEYDLAYPGIKDLGVLGILAGLALLFSDPSTHKQSQRAASPLDCSPETGFLQDASSSNTG